MDILDFARGPALQTAVYVFIVGVLWRLLGIVLLQKKTDLSAPRRQAGLGAALGTIYSRSFSAPAFKEATRYGKILGYLLHIGLFLVVFLFIPHIVFFTDVFGVGWPGLPNNAVYFIGVATVGVAVALLIRRMTNPVLKQISNFDDYFSWLVTMLPVVSGLIMPIRFGVRYETLLAIHILSVALLLIWLPFGKLAHAFLVFYTRGSTGILLGRRGART